MNDTEIKLIAEQIVSGVDMSKLYKDGNGDDEDQVNFWVPVEYKHKYRAIQKASNKRFSKLMKEVIMRCIDKAELEKIAG